MDSVDMLNIYSIKMKPILNGQAMSIQIYCNDFTHIEYELRGPKEHSKTYVKQLRSLAVKEPHKLTAVIWLLLSQKYPFNQPADWYRCESHWLKPLESFHEQPVDCPGKESGDSNNSLIRMSQCNESFQLCSSLPSSFFVPKDLQDVTMISKMSTIIRDHRVPVISYCCPIDYRRHFVMRCAAFDPQSSVGKILTKIVKPLIRIDVNQLVATDRKLELAHRKLRSACEPTSCYNANANTTLSIGANVINLIKKDPFSSFGSFGSTRRSSTKIRGATNEMRSNVATTAFTTANNTTTTTTNTMSSNSTNSNNSNNSSNNNSTSEQPNSGNKKDSNVKFLSKIGRWLYIVSQTLKVAKSIAKTVVSEASVLLVEQDDRHWNCVISSLVQILLEPHTRTIAGFESLVSKEWIYLCGHASRGLHQCNGSNLLFILFLDCVYQIYSQNNRRFEFTSEYLKFMFEFQFKSAPTGAQSAESIIVDNYRMLNPFYTPEMTSLLANCSTSDPVQPSSSTTEIENSASITSTSTTLNARHSATALARAKFLGQPIETATINNNNNNNNNHQQHAPKSSQQQKQAHNGTGPALELSDHIADMRLWSDVYLRWQSPRSYCCPDEYLYFCSPSA